ncbi:MAG: glycerol-3-phosphate dehydrogenase [Hyphomicrobiales bacterium]|nr:MAG: glycerol-3-phosphate dehydrogenase [Hyphomicrobiales bacterium]
MTRYDLLIVGGGVNGCGIARDAAGRGLKVLLCEADDLAGATSSASTKLIHGGLRYLEYYEFGLVRKALKEREVLLALAPHIIWPLRFILPHHRGMRPAWFLRLGLFLYDHIGGRKRLPPTKTLDMRTHPLGGLLKDGFDYGFEYSDCWVDDARLVVLNAVDAAERGADIRVRTECVKAERTGSDWTATLKNHLTGETETVTARALVNATGPWVARFLEKAVGVEPKNRVRMVKGSHIIVPRFFDHDRAYILQTTDGRIVFAIPYEQDFTMVGTTDIDYHGDPRDVAISDDEIDYLCAAASEYFRHDFRRDEIVHTFSGVRPLYDDGASEAKAATRDYVLNVDTGDGAAPRLDVYGGKITTYRVLAEMVLEKLGAFLPFSPRGWTGKEALPGGDFPIDGVGALTEKLAADYPFLSDKMVARFVRTYGTRTWDMLGDAASSDDLGTWFCASLSEREVNYLIDHEWARSAADILWRRSKLGLRCSSADVVALEQFVAERLNARG